MDYSSELYDLICYSELVDECGWESDNNFYVWISYYDIKKFIEELIYLFGYGIFDDGSFNANIRPTCLCINLSEFLEELIDLREIFPMEKFEH